MPRLFSSAVAVLLVLALCVASAAPIRGGHSTALAEPVRRAPVVFALGDSYTMGIRGITPERAYAAEAARTLGWQIVLAGHAGTGFVGTGLTRKTFGTLFNEQLAWRPAPDMVLISGGHNDVWYPPELVAQRARELLNTARHRWPGAQLLLIGPMWGGDPGPKALRVRDVLREAASGLGVPFIDPLAERWITGSVRRQTGNAARFIRADGTHPNPAGNLFIAGRLVSDLRTLGLTRPVLGRTKVTFRPGPSPAPAATPPLDAGRQGGHGTGRQGEGIGAEGTGRERGTGRSGGGRPGEGR
ncbi:SGNH/GDSL hydrolase family protein [Actinomadura xylanilytica]|uniref:SGNH/GDSL hydrolase family protein n=1 Tax=Actinomadura xylanilytica TaxID=887459 RepID=UPI00255AF928|nr:SGNH/GDSL hydrolase family protein [Actinomadura xylanilytica]MDL4772792.1 SGNH/GDSL hydrolase family protein [Actinomadura xylanilytica]